MWKSVEICAGAGGQALGLEQAGFDHLALVENDASACATLRANRPTWNVVDTDLLEWDPPDYRDVDLLAGGVPCPPFSKAGQQLGDEDERNLFPRAIELVRAFEPRAVMLENVRGLLDPVFDEYRHGIQTLLSSYGYWSDWRLLYASSFGVPQLRPRAILVAIRDDLPAYDWPEPNPSQIPPTVGESIGGLMGEGGWDGARQWAEQADTIAPTLVGGSKKHGGPDLGPTRARQAWAKLNVNGSTLADEPPPPGFEGAPRLTVRMTAKLQGFPDDWHITGRKTNSYRQVGNAFPPPVARAVGKQIADVLARAESSLEVVA